MKGLFKLMVTILMIAIVMLLAVSVLQNFGVIGERTSSRGFGPPGMGPGGPGKSSNRGAGSVASSSPDQSAGTGTSGLPDQGAGSGPSDFPTQAAGRGAPGSSSQGAGPAGTPFAGLNSGSNDVSSESAVGVATVERGTISDYIILTGNVEANASVDITTSTGGRITQSALALGRTFKKDDAVAEVDPSSSSTQYAPVPIRVPIDGAITSVLVNEGQTIAAGTSIGTMTSLSKMQIAAYVPERYVGSITLNSQAELSFEAYPDQLFRACVVEKSPVLDPTTRAMEVKIEPGIPDSRIQAGMLAKIRLITNQSTDALLVPLEAVKTSDGKSYVFIVEDLNNGQGTAKKVEIETGIERDNIAEVTSGLSEGMAVVAQGGSLLEDGDAVKVTQTVLVPTQSAGVVTPSVVASTTVKGDLAQYVKTNGVIIARATVEIVPDIAGVVKNLSVKVGDTVRKGQAIATVDPSKPGNQYIPSPVKATIGGVVTSVPVREGASVTTTTTITTIVQLVNPQVRLDVPEAKSASVRIGQTACFILDAYPRQGLYAKVVEISPSVDASTKSQQVTLDITGNPDQLPIRPGMSVQAWILIDNKTNVIKIPRSALQSSGGSFSVYVIGKNKVVTKRKIATGLMTDSAVEVTSGLRAGERVVTQGQAVIGNNQAVQIASEDNLPKAADTILGIER